VGKKVKFRIGVRFGLGFNMRREFNVLINSDVFNNLIVYSKFKVKLMQDITMCSYCLFPVVVTSLEQVVITRLLGRRR
jgi:hypothetical protein